MQTWHLGDQFAAVMIDEHGDSSVHLFDPEFFDGLRGSGQRLSRYALPAHEHVGPLPPRWAQRVEECTNRFYPAGCDGQPPLPWPWGACVRRGAPS